MRPAVRASDGCALHHVVPRLPTLAELGAELGQLSPNRRRAELLWPVALFVAYVGLAATGHWLVAASCVALLLPRFGVAFHDLLHGTLGLPRRSNQRWLVLIGMLALQSGHAVQPAHLEHHRRFPNVDDPEAYIGRMSVPRSLLEGPVYQYRIWRWALRRRPDLRRPILGEAVTHVALVVGSIGMLPWTAVPAVYVALVLLADSLFPALSENFLHNQGGDGPLHRTRTIRGEVFEAYFLELGYHLEHHAYPRVPTRNCRELALRLAPTLSTLDVKPVRVP